MGREIKVTDVYETARFEPRLNQKQIAQMRRYARIITESIPGISFIFSLGDYGNTIIDVYLYGVWKSLKIDSFIFGYADGCADYVDRMMFDNFVKVIMCAMDEVLRSKKGNEKELPEADLDITRSNWIALMDKNEKGTRARKKAKKAEVAQNAGVCCIRCIPCMPCSVANRDLEAV